MRRKRRRRRRRRKEKGEEGQRLIKENLSGLEDIMFFAELWHRIRLNLDLVYHSLIYLFQIIYIANK